MRFQDFYDSIPEDTHAADRKLSVVFGITMIIGLAFAMLCGCAWLFVFTYYGCMRISDNYHKASTSQSQGELK